MIQSILISECGLVTEEDAREALEYVLTEKNEEIGRPATSIAEEDKTIVELTEEREAVKARITEFEVQVPSDEKDLSVADSRDLQEEDVGEVVVTDDKAVSMEDEEKTRKGKTSE